jgi:hypothetical protein
MREWFAFKGGKWWDQDPATFRAFEAMEGDAVPFLIQVLQKINPTRPEQWYEEVFKRLPASLAKSLPKPQTTSVYRDRRTRALMMLRVVGCAQQWQWADEGKPSLKPSITNALPAIRAALHDPDGWIRGSALNAISGMGFLAAPLVPDLIPLIADENAPDSGGALVALGSIGPQASNAVPALIRVAAGRQGMKRQWAVKALGQIGAPAREAIPVLLQAIGEPNVFPRELGLQALAQIGYTPAEAVSALTELRRHPEGQIRGLACLALWNRDHQNTNLYDEIVYTLHATRNGDLVYALGAPGTNAAPFAAELEQSLTGFFPDKPLKRVLKQIRTSGPRSGE